MKTLNLETKVKCSFDTVVRHFNKDLFLALKPPFLHLDVERFDGVNINDEVHLSIGIGPVRQKWISVITDQQSHESEWFFIDEGNQLPPPLKTWHHRHRVIKESEEITVIRDEITFSTGNIITDTTMYPVLAWQFSFRAPAYKKFFEKLD
jgi:ligand-binding SRPBCC domain-containing protein